MIHTFASTQDELLHSTFHELGFVRVTTLLSEVELTTIRAELQRLVDVADSLPTKHVWFSPSVEDGYIVQRISNANRFSPLLHEIGHSHTALRTAAATALGVTNVKFADGIDGSDGTVIVIKDPRNASAHKELRWHQDSKFTKHLPINPFINLGIYLDPSSPEMGGLVVLPRSHRLDIFRSELEETTLIHEGELCVAAELGDICMHSSNLWHCSRAYKQSKGMRRVAYFNYYGAE